jgi:hypothetical protein
MSIVRTREELGAARQRGDGEILVLGQLAAQLRTAHPIIYVGVGCLPIVTVSIAAAPVTFGASLLGAAAITGVETAIIIAAFAVGFALLLAVWMGYDEIEFDAGPSPRLKLRKKSLQPRDKCHRRHPFPSVRTHFQPLASSTTMARRPGSWQSPGAEARKPGIPGGRN